MYWISRWLCYEINRRSVTDLFWLNRNSKMILSCSEIRPVGCILVRQRVLNPHYYIENEYVSALMSYWSHCILYIFDSWILLDGTYQSYNMARIIWNIPYHMVHIMSYGPYNMLNMTHMIWSNFMFTVW